MVMLTDELLEQLGYDPSDKASSLFKEYVEYIIGELNDSGKDKTRELLIDNRSYLYVELAHFITEVGIGFFHKEIERFHSNRDLTQVDIDIYHGIYGDEVNPTYQQSAYLIANYLNKQKERKDSQAAIKVLNRN